MFCKDRETRGGGVLSACANSLLAIPALPNAPPHIESVSVTINTKSPFIISIFYIPPSATEMHFSDFLNYLQVLYTSHNIPIYATGDFNCPDANWSILTSSNYKSTKLCDDLLFDNNLLQLIDFPTHSEGNILNLFLTNKGDSPPVISSISNCVITSDYVPILVTLSSSINKSHKSEFTPLQVFDFAKADFVSLSDYLLEHDYYKITDINSLWSYLSDLLNTTINCFVPKVTIRNSSQPKWFNLQIHHQLNF